MLNKALFCEIVTTVQGLDEKWATLDGKLKEYGEYEAASSIYQPAVEDPIEKLWSTVKSFLRKFKARTLDALPTAIQCAFQTVSPFDCSGWFHSCGYSRYF